VTLDRLVIIGAGDHGRVVADLARAAGSEPVGFVEPDGAAEDSTRAPAGLTVIGSLEQPDAWRSSATAFTVALGDNRARRSAWEACLALGLVPLRLVHPTASLLGGSVVEDGAQVCAGAVIGVDARVMGDAIVNTAATVDHDGVVGPHAQVGPGSHLAGRVTIGEGAFLGTGAIVVPGRSIGAWSLVAAGATGIHDVPDGARVGGVPARPLDDS